MIPGDWTNMTQAVWQSPLLPLSKLDDPAASQAHTKIGAGARFKRDIIAYLKAYGPNKTGKLVQQLQRYDFSAVRAALVASVPSRQKVSELDSKRFTLWGWPALKDLMGQVPIYQQKMKTAESQNKRPHIVTQVGHCTQTFQEPR